MISKLAGDNFLMSIMKTEKTGTCSCRNVMDSVYCVMCNV